MLFPPFGEIVIYPNLERPSDFFANLLVLNLIVLLSVRFLLFNTLYSVFNEHIPLSGIFALSTLSSLAGDTVAWWAQVDSNHRPRAYQARALTT